MAAGQTSLAALADELGIGKPALWRSFRRRGWRTTPAAPDGAAAGAPPDLSPADPDEPEPARAAARRLGLDLDDPEALGSALKANLVVANAGLIGRVNAALSRSDQLGPASLKSLGQALAAARGELERLDVLTAADANAGPAVMTVRALDAAEVRAIQDDAQAAFAGAFEGSDDDISSDEQQPREEGPAEPFAASSGHDRPQGQGGPAPRATMRS